MGLTIVANQFNIMNEIASLKKHQTKTNTTLEEVKKFVHQKWQLNEELKVMCLFILAGISSVFVHSFSRYIHICLHCRIFGILDH